MRYVLCLVLLAPLASPVLADKKDDALIEIQRDIGQLDEKIRDLQKAQGVESDKIEALHSLIQQAASAAAQTSQDVSALKTALTTSLNNALADQQTKISGAVAPLGSRMDALSTSMDQLNATIGAFSDRLSKIDKRLSDLTDQVSALKQAPPPPPAATVPDSTASTTAPPASAVPAGVTRPTLEDDAKRDYYAKRDDLALGELANYVKYFPTDSWAPTAGYLMGMVYLRGKDYDSATQAFQSVIDTYPGNNESQNALFQKAKAYSLWPGHRTEAIQAFNDFVNKYPVNDNVPAAQAELAKLKTPAGAANKKKAPPSKE
jgi:TolA-binding protein